MDLNCAGSEAALHRRCIVGFIATHKQVRRSERDLEPGAVGTETTPYCDLSPLITFGALARKCRIMGCGFCYDPIYLAVHVKLKAKRLIL